MTFKMPQVLLLALTFAAMIAANDNVKDKWIPQAKSCDALDLNVYDQLAPLVLDKISDTYKVLGGNRVAYDASSMSVMMRTGQGAKQDAMVSFYVPAKSKSDMLLMYNYRIGRNDHCVVKVPLSEADLPRFKVNIGDYVAH